MNDHITNNILEKQLALKWNVHRHSGSTHLN